MKFLLIPAAPIAVWQWQIALALLGGVLLVYFIRGAQDAEAQNHEGRQ